MHDVRWAPRREVYYFACCDCCLSAPGDLLLARGQKQLPFLPADKLPLCRLQSRKTQDANTVGQAQLNRALEPEHIWKPNACGAVEPCLMKEDTVGR